MWFLDTGHPVFLVRLLARLCWTVISLASLIALGYVAMLVFNHYNDTSLFDLGRQHAPWLFDGGWKKGLTLVVAALFIGPFLMDLLFGDDNRRYDNNRRGYHDRNNHHSHQNQDY